MNAEHATVGADDDGIRLDRWFKRHRPDLPFGQLARLLRKGAIKLDGKRAEPGSRVSEGSIIRIPPLRPAPPPGPRAPNLSAAEIAEARSWVLHRDDEVIAINKPPGLAVQGGSGTTRHLDGMLDALRFDAAERPRLVHRLDKDTSGVLLLARSAPAAAWLARAFRARDAQKTYWAMVIGVPRHPRGSIRLAIDKRPGRAGEKMEVDDDGKPAHTDYEVLDHAGKRAAWLALYPRTGRTHQLRVHCQAMGHPIVGDGKYGGKDAFLTGGVSRKLQLHARSIRIDRPSGGILDITAPLPSHMAESFRMLGFAEGAA